MPRRSRPASEPDLFSLEPARPRPTPPVEPQAAIVPHAKPAISIDDLRQMIAGWSDPELEQLRVMVPTEIQGRILLPVEPVHVSPSAAGVERAGGQAVRQRKHEDSVQEVAPGQVSAIRAAIQVGMTPGEIAREFGLPLAAVKRTLAASASS